MKESFVKLLDNIAKLITVKTIISLMVMTALTIGFLNKLVPVEMYGTIAGSIITYFFTRKE